MAPGKDILVLSQECCECLTDWRTGKGADPGHLLRSCVIEKYLLQPLNGLYNRPLLFYAHSLQVVVHFQHRYVALACYHLVFPYLSHFVLGGKLDH